MTQPIYKLLMLSGRFERDEKTHDWVHLAGVRRVITIQPGDILPECGIKVERYLRGAEGQPDGVLLHTAYDSCRVHPGPMQTISLLQEGIDEWGYFSHWSTQLQLQLLPIDEAPLDFARIIAPTPED